METTTKKEKKNKNPAQKKRWLHWKTKKIYLYSWHHTYMVIKKQKLHVEKAKMGKLNYLQNCIQLCCCFFFFFNSSHSLLKTEKKEIENQREISSFFFIYAFLRWNTTFKYTCFAFSLSSKKIDFFFFWFWAIKAVENEIEEQHLRKRER